MRQVPFDQAYPFVLDGLKIKKFSPKNSADIEWHGVPLLLKFSNPVFGDDTETFQETDVHVHFWQRDLSELLRSVFPPQSPHHRLRFTTRRNETDFFPEAVDRFKGEVESFLEANLYENVVEAGLGSYIKKQGRPSISINLSRDQRGDLSISTVTLQHSSKAQKVKLFLAYSYEKEVFYCRYKVNSDDPQSFDGNDPVSIHLSDMAHSLLMDLRDRGWC